MTQKIADQNTHNDELDRLLWACEQWFAGWKPDPTITDRRDRDLYDAIDAMGPRLAAMRDLLRRTEGDSMTTHTTPAGEPGGNATEDRAITLRDAIAEAITDTVAIDVDFGGTYEFNPATVDESTTRILAMVRRAILSDVPIEAGADAYWHADADKIEAAFTSALDAAGITGEPR